MVIGVIVHAIGYSSQNINSDEMEWHCLFISLIMLDK